MNNFAKNDNKVLKELLSKSSTAYPSNNFTDILMGKVKNIVVRDHIFNKYLSRSIFFTILSIVLLVLALLLFPNANSIFANLNNKIFLSFIQLINYIVASGSTILILYQINNIATLRKPQISTS